MNLKLTAKKLLVFLFLLSSIALGAAYVSQYFFGLKPCILCLYQRVPFFAIIFVSVFALFLKSEKLQKIAVFICIFLLIINAAIAFFHVGVENKIFQMTQKCATSEIENFNTVEELRDFLEAQSLAKCDEPQFFFLGLSMAAWNVIFCLGLAGFVLILSGFCRKNRQK